MTVRKQLGYAVPFALATILAGPATAGVIFNDVAAIRDQNPTGTAFAPQLTSEYKKLAIFEADEMYDWIDAEKHATKGMMSANGQIPMPSDPADFNIKYADKLAELQAARADLVSQMNAGAPTIAPHEAAVAQAKYDCWVEQQEEGHQPDDIAACLADFLAAMQNLLNAMNTVPVTNTTEEIARETVYFAFDKSDITAEASAQLQAFVAEMKAIRPVVTLFIAGHTDTSGPSDYNAQLSQRRALAVREALEADGMTVRDYAELDLEAEGETKPAVQTGDGVRERLNRRVEIIARGVKTQTKVIPAS